MKTMSYLVLIILVLFWTSTSTDYAYGQGGSVVAEAGLMGEATILVVVALAWRGWLSRWWCRRSRRRGGYYGEVTILPVAAITVAGQLLSGKSLLWQWRLLSGRSLLWRRTLLSGRLLAWGVWIGPGWGWLDGVRGGVPVLFIPVLSILCVTPVVVEQQPPTYVEPEQPQESYWYHCDNPEGYYHMSRGVQTDGRRWRHSRLRLNSDGGYKSMKWHGI